MRTADCGISLASTGIAEESIAILFVVQYYSAIRSLQSAIRISYISTGATIPSKSSPQARVRRVRWQR